MTIRTVSTVTQLTGTADQNGGSRVLAVTSDRDDALQLFESRSDLIAEPERRATVPADQTGGMQSIQFWVLRQCPAGDCSLSNL